MKKISIIFALIMAFNAGYAVAQQFVVDIAGDSLKDFVTVIDLLPGQQITFAHYLQYAEGPHNTGGVWLDWTGSTDLIS